MNDLTFSKLAFEQYAAWQTEDKKTVTKINKLIEDIQRNGYLKGIGKPESLKHIKGYSREIDKFNRFVYQGNEKNDIYIVSCKGHY
jgi:toxin YoeB